ncbi:MAG: SDR family NAD(P)-dependent oxidoreductase [Alphaproteobacteria bacterium]
MATYLITGVNRGIGAELAKQASAAGHEVIGTSRIVPAGKDWLQFDVTDEESVVQFAHDIAARNVDILICNAGVYVDKGENLETGFDADLWAQGMAVNVAGVFATIQAALPNIRKSGGKIAVISSKMGSNTHAKGGSYIYRASKAAVTNLVSNLAVDLRDEGIALGSYHPGWVVTDMGGSNAYINTETSAKGLLARIDILSMATTGVFEEYDGVAMPF